MLLAGNNAGNFNTAYVALVYVVQCRAVNRDILTDVNSYLQCFDLPLVLRHCWLGVRKSIRPVKNWVVRCWHGYLSGARCKWFVYGPAGPNAIMSLCFISIQIYLAFWCQLTQVVLEKWVSVYLSVRHFHVVFVFLLLYTCLYCWYCSICSLCAVTCHLLF